MIKGGQFTPFLLRRIGRKESLVLIRFIPRGAIL
jgi:hypothetical protein